MGLHCFLPQSKAPLEGVRIAASTGPFRQRFYLARIPAAEQHAMVEPSLSAVDSYVP